MKPLAVFGESPTMGTRSSGITTPYQNMRAAPTTLRPESRQDSSLTLGQVSHMFADVGIAQIIIQLMPWGKPFIASLTSVVHSAC